MANPKTPPKNQSKFSVYVNPAISSALSARSLRPSMFAFAIIITVCLASAVAMLGLFVWEQTVVELIATIGILQYIAYGVVKVLQIIVGLVFLAGILALLKALSLQRMADSNGLDVFQTPPRDSATRSTPNKPATRSTPNKPTPTSGFTEHQQELLGLRKRNVEQGNTDTPSNIGSRQQPQRSKKSSTPSPSSLLAPVHQLASKSSRGLGPGQSQWSGLERRDVGVSNISPFTIPVANRSPGSQGTPSLPGSQVPGQNTSPWDRQFSTPWSKPRPSLTKEEIPTEEKLEEFLADVEEKMSESASKAPTPSNQGLTTPSPSLHGIGGSTPSPVPNSGSFSGTPRNTSLRTVRMSPSSQKFSTPPKKGDGDLPPPMSLEQSMEAFQNLGVYPHIEQWSDRLRQWFSEVLLNPLVQKIETSHIQVMQAAAKLGISITITQVGSNVPDSGVPSAASSDNAANEWQTTFTLDEDGVLHQLRATLIQARDAPPTPQPSLLGLQPPKEKPFNPLIQECLDAVTEHQRLRALMKGEWVKGLLPQSSVRADYTVQRIKELAEGTCVSSLSPADRLSVVAFSSTAKRMFPLRRMVPKGQRAVRRVIDGLACSEGTNIADGLKKAAKILEDRRERNPVASIMLLSDGQDKNSISTLQNRQTLPGSIRQSTRYGHIEIPVHAFGFGNDHDAAKMHTISEESGGTFSFIKAEASVQDAFAERIGGLLSVVAQDVQLTLSCSSAPGVELQNIHAGSCQTRVLDDYGTVKLGDLYAEEDKDIIVELKIPAVKYPNPMAVLGVKCSFKDPVSQQTMYAKEQILIIPRPDSVRGYPTSVSLEVEKRKNRVRTEQAIAEARTLADSGDTNGAQQVLYNAKALLQCSPVSRTGDELRSAVEAEIAEIQAKVRQNFTYERELRSAEIPRERQPRSTSSNYNERQRSSNGYRRIDYEPTTPSMLDIVMRLQTDNDEPLTPTSAWRAAEKLAKVAMMRKSLNRVSDLHGFENARF